MATAGAAGRLLSTLVDGGPMSRAEATSRAAVSRSAAGTAVDDLIRLGLIQADAPHANGRGRPSSMLRIRASGAAVIACEITTQDAVLATQHLDGTLTDLETVPLGAISRDADEVLTTIAERLRTRVDALGARCVGVGVSIPGMVNRETGVATLVLPLGWRNVPVRDVLEHSLPPVSTIVAQDALLAAIAEFHLGAGASADRMLLLISESVGIGGAIVGLSSARQPANHSLQAGHVIVDPRGPKCACGASGCLELYADGRAFGRATGLGATVTPQQMASALAAGLDEKAVEGIAREVLPAFTTGLVSLVNALGPDRIVLAGLLKVLTQLPGVQLEEGISQSVVGTAERVTVVQAELTDSALRGAGYEAFGSLFQDPDATLQKRMTVQPKSTARIKLKEME